MGHRLAPQAQAVGATIFVPVCGDSLWVSTSFCIESKGVTR